MKRLLRTAIASAIVVAGGLSLVAAWVVVHRTGSVPAAVVARDNLEGQDSNVGRAAELVARAEDMLNRGDQGAARELYAQALALYRDQANPVGQGDVHLGLGRVDHYTGQSDSARAHFDEGLAHFRRGGSDSGAARLLAARGDLEKDTFNWADAAAYYREARAAWDRVPEPKSDPHVVFRMVGAPSMPDGEQEARSVLAQAELIFETIGDPEGLGDVHVLAGRLLVNLGSPGAARGDFGNAQGLFKEAGAKGKMAASALEAARIDVHFGDNRSAQAALDVALDAFERLGDRAGAGAAHMVGGDLQRLLGRLEDAAADYERAAGMLQEVEDSSAAWALLKQGDVESYLGRWERAHASIGAAAAAFRVYGPVRGEAWATVALGRLAARDSDGVSAEALLDVAVELFRQAGDPLGEGRALLARGALAASRQGPAPARAAYSASSERFAEAGAPFGNMLAALGRGDVARASGEDEAARSAYLEAAALFEAMAEPIAEANRHLGLPPVSSLRGTTANAGLPMGEGLEVAPLEQADAENLAAFPDHNIEARSLVAVVVARLAAAQRQLGLN